MDKISSENLFKKFARGDLEAFDVLYTRHGKKLYIYAYSLLKNNHEAEEAMQEVFTSMLSRTERFSCAKNLQAYIFMVCRNHCLDVLDKRKRAEKARRSEKFTLIKSESPHLKAAEKEEAENLNRIINDLPEPQREVLVLKVYSGLTLDEIASTVEVPRGTVATRYTAALKKIRNVLQAKEN